MERIAPYSRDEGGGDIFVLESVNSFKPQCEVKDVVMKHRQEQEVAPVTNVVHLH